MCCGVDVNQLGRLFRFIFLLNGKIYKNWRSQPGSQWPRLVSREVIVRGRKISANAQCYNTPPHVNALHKMLGLIWPAYWQRHTQTRTYTRIRQQHYIRRLFPRAFFLRLLFSAVWTPAAPRYQTLHTSKMLRPSARTLGGGTKQINNYWFRCRFICSPSAALWEKSCAARRASGKHGSAPNRNLSTLFSTLHRRSSW